MILFVVKICFIYTGKYSWSYCAGQQLCLVLFKYYVVMYDFVYIVVLIMVQCVCRVISSNHLIKMNSCFVFSLLSVLYF